jgi:hypothetical protein
VANRYPEIAVQHSLSSLDVLAERHPASLPRVRARLKPEVRAALEGAVRSDFLPASVDVALAAAIVAELGLADARRVAREVLRRSFTGTLLGTLLSSAQVLFGPTPSSILRWAGRGWSRVCRDCGEMRFAGSAEDVLTLELDGVPAVMDVPDYLEAVAGGLEGLLEVLGVEGDATVERPGGRLLFRLRVGPRLTPQPGPRPAR